jgi:cell division protein FtsQ
MAQTVGPSSSIPAPRSRRNDETTRERRKRTRKPSMPLKKRGTVVYSNEVPVMVRGDSMAVPTTVKTRRNKVRRRYDLALNVPGAEVRLPALPVIRVGWRLVSFMLTILLVGGLYFAWTSPIFQVQKADISGLQRLNEASVNAVLDVGGEPIFTANPVKMKTKLLEAFPELTSASIIIKLPNTVTVNIVERVPILVWRQDGKSVLVDADGYAFPVREPDAIEPNLVVEANHAPPVEMPPVDPDVTQMRFLPVEMVSGILSMSALVSANTPIVYDAKHGLGWKDKRGWEVYFGNAGDMDMKLKIYTAVVKKLKAEKITPALISVEYVHAPYYRLER